MNIFSLVVKPIFSFKNRIKNMKVFKAIMLTHLLFFFPCVIFTQTLYKDSVKHQKKGEYYYNLDYESISIDSGIFYIQKAIFHFEKAGNYLDLIAAIGFENHFHFANVNLKLVKANIDKIFKIYNEKKLSKLGSNYATDLSNLGVYYHYLEQLDSAIILYRQALSLEEKIPQALPNIWSSYLNIGWLYSDYGDYNSALSFFENSQIKANEVPPNEVPSPYQKIHHGLAKVNFELGDFNKTKQHIELALNFLKPQKVGINQLQDKLILNCYQWLAKIAIIESELDKAKDHLEKATFIQSFHSNIQERYLTYEYLGDLSLAKEAFIDADDYYEKALNAVKKEYKDFQKHPLIAKRIIKLANANLQLAQTDQALDLYQKALETNALNFIATDHFDNPKVEDFIGLDDALPILSGKAKAFQQKAKEVRNPQKHLIAALDTYQLINQLIQKNRQLYLAEGSKNLLAKEMLPIYEAAVAVALELNQLTGEEKFLKEAYHFVEGNKAMLLLESIKDNEAKGYAGLPDSLYEKEKAMRLQIAYFKKKLAEATSEKKANSDSQKKWKQKLFELEEDYNLFVQNLENEYPKYYESKYNIHIAAVEEVQEKLLDAQTAVLEFLVGTERIYLFCITKNAVEVFPIENPAALETTVIALRNILTTPPQSLDFDKNFDQFANLSSDLYNHLLKESLENAKTKNVKNLLLIPDDFLSFLPFEILLLNSNFTSKDYAPDNLAYLFEDYSLSYNFSTTLMLQQPGRKDAASLEPFLGFAPTFGSSNAEESRNSEARACAGGDLYNLNCNKGEVESINELFEGFALYGNEAGKQYFLDNASKYRIIHLATHACIDEENPGFNQIFFSDGYLSNFDFNNIELNADLTVLSACNTGSGKLLKGEGVMSLARGFTLAGSASTLTSLWQVHDCATSKIMTAYFGGIKQGLPKNDALKQAKLRFLNDADKEFAHPYFWAAFAQFGDVRPLYGNSINWMLWGGIFLAAIGFGFFFFTFKK